MHRKGFTMIEVLFALSVTLLIVINGASLLRIIKVEKNTEMITLQNENSTYTLCHSIRGGKQFTYGDELTFYKDEELHRIKLEGNRLVLKPGSVIFYDGIENVEFEVEEGMIYVSFRQEGKEYRYWIGNDYEMEEEG